jgi:hypothetical protein
MFMRASPRATFKAKARRAAKACTSDISTLRMERLGCWAGEKNVSELPCLSNKKRGMPAIVGVLYFVQVFCATEMARLAPADSTFCT